MTRYYAPSVSSPERFWASRLRWRLRGALQWPAFVVLTLADGLVLDALPPVGTVGLNLIEGVLIATFANLFLVGAAAPFLTRMLVERRAAALASAGAEGQADIERDVLQDRMATGLLVAGLLATIAAGLGNRPVMVSETEATETNARVVRDFVEHTRSDELIRNLETANTVRLGEGYFRTCIARDDRERFFCLLVDTKKDPPEVVKDPSAEPNTVYRR
jgi:hypothetical protein